MNIGDEVVVIRASFGNSEEVGRKGIIHTFNDGFSIYFTHFQVALYGFPGTFGYKNGDIELTELSKSPLWQALK